MTGSGYRVQDSSSQLEALREENARLTAQLSDLTTARATAQQQNTFILGVKYSGRVFRHLFRWGIQPEVIGGTIVITVLFAGLIGVVTLLQMLRFLFD